MKRPESAYSLESLPHTRRTPVAGFAQMLSLPLEESVQRRILNAIQVTSRQPNPISFTGSPSHPVSRSRSTQPPPMESPREFSLDHVQRGATRSAPNALRTGRMSSTRDNTSRMSEWASLRVSLFSLLPLWVLAHSLRRRGRPVIFLKLYKQEESHLWD